MLNLTHNKRKANLNYNDLLIWGKFIMLYRKRVLLLVEWTVYGVYCLRFKNVCRDRLA